MKTREKIAHLYVQETGKDFDTVMRDIERIIGLRQEEAKDYGLVTSIVHQWSGVSLPNPCHLFLSLIYLFFCLI